MFGGADLVHLRGTGVYGLHTSLLLCPVCEQSSKATQSFLSECTCTPQQPESRGGWMTWCTCESLSSLSQQILGPEFVISGKAKPRF